jgi:hypothetical protein
MVALSKTTDDWPPGPDKPLSDGTLAACYAVIHHLEANGVRFPLEEGGRGVRNGKGPTRTGKRLRQITTARRAALETSTDAALWDAAYQVTKLTGYLMSLNIEDASLDAHGLDVLNDLADDVLYLQDWSDRTLLSVQARLGEQGLRKKIAALRAKTVENGCSAEEAAVAQRMAVRLERKLSAQLGA